MLPSGSRRRQGAGRGIQRGYHLRIERDSFRKATQAFQQSIKVAPASDAKRLADQEDAYYNLGNALYRAGQQFEKSAPQEAIQKWTEAVKAYDTALQLRADDADSKYNRDFVKRKIDALRQPPDQGGGGGRWSGAVAVVGGQGQGNGQRPPQGQPQAKARARSAARATSATGATSAASAASAAGTASAAAAATTLAAAETSLRPSAAGSPPPAPAAIRRGPTRGNGLTMRRITLQRLSAAPGQMSAEEARELLDSAKSDEHHSLGVPSGPRDPNAPDKAFKNW